MSAPDFYFAVNAVFRHIHDAHGPSALHEFWRSLGREHYRARWQAWRTGGVPAVADDWRRYFDAEPGAIVRVSRDDAAVTIDVTACPAIKHLRDHGRDIVPYFCEHCDHICGAMADAAGYAFERQGGGGSCQQRFVQLRTPKELKE